MLDRQKSITDQCGCGNIFQHNLCWQGSLKGARRITLLKELMNLKNYQGRSFPNLCPLYLALKAIIGHNNIFEIQEWIMQG
jgi:hypothetical protein